MPARALALRLFFQPTHRVEGEGSLLRRTLRQIMSESELPPGFHWPGSKKPDPEVLIVLVKCVHCQNPSGKTLGDLEWDEKQGRWVCPTPGCDAVLIHEEWFPNQQVYSKPLK